MKKYEYTGRTQMIGGVILNRIKRLSDGLVGGWIEKEENLSHDGDCFVYDEAVVAGKALVCDNAKVCGNASVSDNARVCGDAIVSNHAVVSGSASVLGSAMVSGNALVCGKVVVRDGTWVSCSEVVFGDDPKPTIPLPVTPQKEAVAHDNQENDETITSRLDAIEANMAILMSQVGAQAGKTKDDDLKNLKAGDMLNNFDGESGYKVLQVVYLYGCYHLIGSCGHSMIGNKEIETIEKYAKEKQMTKVTQKRGK